MRYDARDHQLTLRVVVDGFAVYASRQEVLDETLTREDALNAHTRSNDLKPTQTMVGGRVLFSATGQKYVISGKLRLLA